MKKTLLLLTILFAIQTQLFGAQSQTHLSYAEEKENPQVPEQHNLGVRIGGFGGYDFEVSWQTVIGNGTVELDFGPANHRNRDYVGFIGIYQWSWEIGNEFYVYAGVGPSMRIYTDNDTEYNPLGLGAAGQAGIAYRFPMPLQISLDLRPSFDLFNLKAHYWSLGLGIRYRF